MSTTPTPLPDAPDGFTCPHRHQCWQREAVRIALTIAIAVLTAWLYKGCTVQVEGPGLTYKGTAVWPTTQQAAAFKQVRDSLRE